MITSLPNIGSQEHEIGIFEEQPLGANLCPSRREGGAWVGLSHMAEDSFGSALRAEHSV